MFQWVPVAYCHAPLKSLAPPALLGNPLLKTSFLHAEQMQVSASPRASSAPTSSPSLWLSLDSLQFVDVLSESGHSSPDAVLYPSAYNLCSRSYSSAWSQLPLLQGHAAVSCHTCGPLGLPSPFLANCCLSAWPLAVLLPGVVPWQVQDLVFAFVEFHEVFLSSFLQLVKLPLNSGNSGLQYINYPPHFGIICKL